MTRDQIITQAIEASPLNRGLCGGDWLSEPGNVAIVQGNDVVLFDARGDDIFEVHFLLASRGRAAIDVARMAFAWLFIHGGGRLIMGLVPDFRRDVKMLARWAGGKSVGIRQTINGPCELFVLPIEMWKAAQ